MSKVKITALKIAENKSSLNYKVNGIQVKDEIDWFGSTESEESELFDPIDSIEGGSCYEREEGWYTEMVNVYPEYSQLTKPQVIRLLEWSFAQHKDFHGLETVEEMIEDLRIDYIEAKANEKKTKIILKNINETIKRIAS